MKKDTTATIRINGQIKEILKDKGISIQQIIDQYIKDHIKLDIKIKVD